MIYMALIRAISSLCRLFACVSRSLMASKIALPSAGILGKFASSAAISEAAWFRIWMSVWSSMIQHQKVEGEARACEVLESDASESCFSKARCWPCLILRNNLFEI